MDLEVPGHGICNAEQLDLAWPQLNKLNDERYLLIIRWLCHD